MKRLVFLNSLLIGSARSMPQLRVSGAFVCSLYFDRVAMQVAQLLVLENWELCHISYVICADMSQR